MRGSTGSGMEMWLAAAAVVEVGPSRPVHYVVVFAVVTRVVERWRSGSGVS